MERRAKIVATLGPASSSDEIIGRMLRAGLDVVRLNLSHGDHDSHRELIRAVRRQADAQKRFIPIVLDLMGPRYRLGKLRKGPRWLQEGATLRLVGEEGGGEGDGEALTIGQPEILDHLREGERVLIDDGLVELEVTSVEGDAIEAKVERGGEVSSRKGVNLPDTDLPFEISDKDRRDIAFAVEEGADYLAASFVHRADDLRALREVAREAGDELPLIAKLERQGSIDRLDELVAEADALMVARGDLGVEVPLYRVPVLQKQIVAAGREAGKPVIVATEMLESMIEKPRPTRAEATDVANAVFDGADALMLSGETAAGAHPVESVAVMCRIVEEAEDYAFGAEPARRLTASAFGDAVIEDPGLEEIAQVISAAAVYAADRLPVRRIVAFSQGGFTARMVARNRPESPILVFTTDERVARRIQLVWGVRPLLMEAEVEHHDEVVAVVERRLLESGLVEKGETVVILMGDPIGERPLTNLMRVHRLG